MFKLTAQEERFIEGISSFLPTRRPGKRDPKPVDKITITRQLFIEFKCTAEEKATRGLIEKSFEWVKSFNSMVRGKARKRSTIIGSILFVTCYVVFGRLLNLGKL